MILKDIINKEKKKKKKKKKKKRYLTYIISTFFKFISKLYYILKNLFHCYLICLQNKL